MVVLVLDGGGGECNGDDGGGGVFVTLSHTASPTFDSIADDDDADGCASSSFVVSIGSVVVAVVFRVWGFGGWKSHSATASTTLFTVKAAGVWFWGV